jgi:hypothetical protein
MNFINYIEKITGVDIFGLTSFLIFFVFFIIMSVYAWRADKKFIDIMKQIPLDGGEKNI